MHRQVTGCLCAVLLLAAAGCSNKDADQLGLLARTVAGKFDNLTGSAQERLANGLQAAKASWSETTPDVRVTERLRWDKQLNTIDILVDSPSTGVVRLQGTVGDGDLRRRALDLAQNTLGVDKVVDELGGDSGEQ